jgi:hypothetical protein
MTSAEKLLGIPSQLLMTARPCCQASRTPFARAMCSSSVFATMMADPASRRGISQGFAA